MSDSITADLFSALNILVLERLDFGLFQIDGNVPNWVEQFCSQKFTTGMEILIPQKNFSFLENFLIDAEEFWQRNSDSKLTSGIWTDQDINNTEYHFEAVAISVNNRKFLLIETLDEKYHEKQYIIQKARENQLIYQQWLKDNQKKDILIHCIIHDMAGQLSGMNGCFALLEFENLTPKGKERLEIGKKQSLQQEILIGEILDAFSAEIQSLESFTFDIDKAPDILNSIQDVITLSKPSFILNNIRLQLANNTDINADWKVVGEQSRLNRVIFNLVENALRYSPQNSTVIISLQSDLESILVNVDDQGVGIQPEMVENLFNKFSQGKYKSGKSGLGLYFCRITVERWGGKIGYSPKPEGGSRFWFRLLRPELRRS
ncbi:MAG: HAMP domain-containing histidine kinase [Desmonostoc vinosum HA7617-LM4]|jgi:signal transduction histidine kinase|nr:HAMP domain-containing histidine kinase [Desmonostoc vinosum HA7617-LM4]